MSGAKLDMFNLLCYTTSIVVSFPIKLRSFYTKSKQRDREGFKMINCIYSLECSSEDCESCSRCDFLLKHGDDSDRGVWPDSGTDAMDENIAQLEEICCSLCGYPNCQGECEKN